jgi:uncharacterized membrane protein (UPF0127 family)
MLLVNKTDGKVISENLAVADTFFKRLKGLMFTKELPAQEALHIIPCNEIHTFFMNYSIDVLYLDKDKRIVHMDEEMEPGKIGKKVENAISVVELPGGRIKTKSLKLGQSVEFRQG